MLWGCAAAAAHNVQEARFGPLADLRGHRPGIKIVLAKGVGQPGVRVGGDVALGDARQLLHVLTQLIRPQGAVQPEGQRVGVAE